MMCMHFYLRNDVFSLLTDKNGQTHHRQDPIALLSAPSDNVYLYDNFAAPHEQIRVAVMAGQRPDLSAIGGPKTLLKQIRDCISRCCYKHPERRPSFAGKCISVVGKYHNIFHNVEISHL